MGIIKRIHVNQLIIKANQKNPDQNQPPLTVKTSKENIKANQVEILDDNGQVLATVVYSPDKPLSCGARVWIETKADIRCK
jgi:hypothetical protein